MVAGQAVLFLKVLQTPYVPTVLGAKWDEGPLMVLLLEYMIS